MIALFVAIALTLYDPVAIDGDTLSADGERYRVVGIDAPETERARCAVERVRGEAAKARVAGLLRSAGSVQAHRKTWRWPQDRYGRRLASVTVDGRSLADLLVAEGLAVRWNGRAPKPDFCR